MNGLTSGISRLTFSEIDIDDKTAGLILEAAFEIDNLQIMRFLKSKKVGRLFVKKLSELSKSNPRYQAHSE